MTNGNSGTSSLAGTSSSIVASYTYEVSGESILADDTSESELASEFDELVDKDELEKVCGARTVSSIFFCKGT